MDTNINVEFLECNSIFEDLTISDVTAHDAQFDDKHFLDCNFRNCDFNESSFTMSSFSNCSFTDCNLSLIKIGDSRIENTQFMQCKMIGIDWTQAIWNNNTSKKKANFSIEFKDCTLNYSIFIGLNLYKAMFVECSMREVGFESANLQESDFSNSDLTGAIFNETNLSKANLSLAKNYTINVCRNNILKARFSMPEAISLVYALDIVL